MAGTSVAAPQTALYGLATSLAGSYIGGKIGQKFSKKEEGQVLEL